MWCVIKSYLFDYGSFQNDSVAKKMVALPERKGDSLLFYACAYDFVLLTLYANNSESANVTASES